MCRMWGLLNTDSQLISSRAWHSQSSHRAPNGERSLQRLFQWTSHEVLPQLLPCVFYLPGRRTANAQDLYCQRPDTKTQKKNHKLACVLFPKHQYLVCKPEGATVNDEIQRCNGMSAVAQRLAVRLAILS